MTAFSTASRIKLLYALAGGAVSVDELARTVGMTPNAVSQQLRVLRQLRLVTAERCGRNVQYRLHDQHLPVLLAAVRHQLDHAEHGWSDPTKAPEAALETPR